MADRGGWQRARGEGPLLPPTSLFGVPKSVSGSPRGSIRTMLTLNFKSSEMWSTWAAQKRKRGYEGRQRELVGLGGFTSTSHGTFGQQAAPGSFPEPKAQPTKGLPMLITQMWVLHLHFSCPMSLLSRFYFPCTCLPLSGSFSKSYTFISRCSLSLAPKTKHPSMTWHRGAELTLAALSQEAQDTSQLPVCRGDWPAPNLRLGQPGLHGAQRPSGARPRSPCPTTQPAPELALLPPLICSAHSRQRRVTMTSFYLL